MTIIEPIVTAISAVSAAIAPIQPALVTGLLGLFGIMLTRQVTKGQLSVQQQTLFVSLIDRRLTWQKGFRDAVKKWDEQMGQIIGDRKTDTIAPTGLFEMGVLLGEARWLFGTEVAAAAKAIDDQAKVVVNLRIAASGGNHDAAARVGDAVLLMYDLLDPLSDAIKPYLYLGDIKRPKKVVKVPERLKTIGKSKQ
ncbi:hypothetical protein DM806_13700 [Sphingobium lactosutens]|uniref:hypothetical protein n=1 Tax=Sphingobium lactosutens TaxID=522773 RepID=UPI0015B99187|nr:hypothetical protein [Sphingobium lactosutens]NWK96695.1 hypothetical protein [Sphingobium lactosutens]